MGEENESSTQPPAEAETTPGAERPAIIALVGDMLAANVAAEALAASAVAEPPVPSTSTPGEDESPGDAPAATGAANGLEVIQAPAPDGSDYAAYSSSLHAIMATGLGIPHGDDGAGMIEKITLAGEPGWGVQLPGSESLPPIRQAAGDRGTYTVVELSVPVKPTNGYAARSLNGTLGGEDARTLADLAAGLREVGEIKNPTPAQAIGWLLSRIRREQRGA